MDTRSACGCCLAHGLITLHVRTEAGDRHLPAALYDGMVGEGALRRGGLRVRRVTRWDAAGWETWWTLLAGLAGGRPAVVALAPLREAGEIPDAFPVAYLVPPTVALRAASPVPWGIALYLGAFSCEVAAFGPGGMDEPAARPGGLEPLYRSVIAAFFRREHRPILPLQVPDLLREGFPIEVDGLLEGIAPLLGEEPVLLGGEDEAVVAAVAAALGQRGHETAVADPLVGLERLARAAGGIG